MFYHHISALSELVKCAERFISGLSVVKRPGLFPFISATHSEIEDYFAIKQAGRERNTCFFSHSIKPNPTDVQVAGFGLCEILKDTKGAQRISLKRCGNSGDIKETITLPLKASTRKLIRETVALNNTFWWWRNPVFVTGESELDSDSLRSNNKNINSKH
jgi:hypothetical protein